MKNMFINKFIKLSVASFLAIFTTLAVAPAPFGLLATTALSFFLTGVSLSVYVLFHYISFHKNYTAN
jgi:hypothetical protein